tara:strand:+ start:1628 stop:1930 length:303 start_codon:yes stop_codon:yes gene_type:complete
VICKKHFINSSRCPSGFLLECNNRQNDFAFIVTYGASQGRHSFDEGITEEGFVAWQSQPSNNFKDKRIQQLIVHNELTNNIYLFLRDNKKSDYEYLVLRY